MTVRNGFKNLSAALGVGLAMAALPPVVLADMEVQTARQTMDAGEQTSGFMTIESAIEIALLNNPGLMEIGLRAEAAAAVPSQAGSLPDPMLNLLAANLPVDSFDLNQENMTQMRIGISQAFPFPGKLRLKKEAAEFEAAATEHDYAQARLNLVRDIKIEWWRLFYLDRTLEIVDRNLELMRGLVEIAGQNTKLERGCSPTLCWPSWSFQSSSNLRSG